MYIHRQRSHHPFQARLTQLPHHSKQTYIPFTSRLSPNRARLSAMCDSPSFHVTLAGLSRGPAVKSDQQLSAALRYGYTGWVQTFAAEAQD